MFTDDDGNADNSFNLKLCIDSDTTCSNLFTVNYSNEPAACARDTLTIDTGYGTTLDPYDVRDPTPVVGEWTDTAAVSTGGYDFCGEKRWWFRETSD